MRDAVPAHAVTSVLIGLFAVGPWGCGSSPAMHAATIGDRAALREALAREQTTARFSLPQAASLAKAVAEHDIRGRAEETCTARIDDVESCAHELDDALAFRMQTHDAAGAESALLRIEGRALDLGDARAFANDSDSLWRAVGARGFVRPPDAANRLRALVDPDPRVRREAARASRDARDAGDLRVLADAARLDPDPLVRTGAVRAIAALPAVPGDRVANILRDLWTLGDEGLRGDIAVSWAGPSVWGAGGRDALRTTIESGQGPAAVEAAAAVLRRREPDAEMTRAASSLMARALRGGSRVARLAAIAYAPLAGGELGPAMRAASEEDDPEIRVAALARLAEASDASAVSKLEDLARPGSSVASSARWALASAGDRRVQAWLEADLNSASAEERLGAGTALATLGVPARAASLLADPEPRVRLRAACAIITAARVVR